MTHNELAARIERAGTGGDTLRFSECIVQGKRGYQRGWVSTTSPEIMRIMCDMWNARAEIAAGIRARSAS